MNKYIDKIYWIEFSKKLDQYSADIILTHNIISKKGLEKIYNTIKEVIEDELNYLKTMLDS